MFRRALDEKKHVLIILSLWKFNTNKLSKYKIRVGNNGISFINCHINCHLLIICKIDGNLQWKIIYFIQTEIR